MCPAARASTTVVSSDRNRSQRTASIVHLLSQLQGTSREETRQMLSGGLPGLSPGQADEESFRCPDAACDRVGTTLPAGPIPRCQLTSQPMTRW